MTLPDSHTATIEDAYLVADRLHESWAWLALLVESGPSRRMARPVTDAQRARDTIRAREDRESRVANAANGAIALAPEPVPVNLAVLDAQAVIHDLVLSAARLVAVAGNQAYIPHAHTSVGLVIEAIDWLTLSLPARFAVDPAGTAVGQLARPAALVDVRDPLLLGTVLRSLTRADRIAREAAGVVDAQWMPLRAPCPACGRRSLYVGGLAQDDARRRYVACNRVSCTCTGADCGCGQRVRYGPVGDRPGRRHVWPRGEWEGPYGLAARLGVTPQMITGMGKR
jgi:hypothetical protein